MPRRNKQPKLQRLIPRQSDSAGKTRYATKQDALAAAEYRMRYHLDIQLSVYQSPQDRGWYLTSKPPTST